MTDEIDVTTVIHAPRDEVFAFLRDVEGYGAYSEYIQGVSRRGDGDVGTEYGITLSWWRLCYTVRARVTDVDPPGRIAWRLTEGVDARGAWRLDPTTVDDPSVDDATRVTLLARFEPDSADAGVLSLPPLVSTSTVVAKARPIVEREAERVLSRVVADLEDEPRRASLTIRTRPGRGRGSTREGPPSGGG